MSGCTTRRRRFRTPRASEWRSSAEVESSAGTSKRVRQSSVPLTRSSIEVAVRWRVPPWSELSPSSHVRFTRATRDEAIVPDPSAFTTRAALLVSLARVKLVVVSGAVNNVLWHTTCPTKHRIKATADSLRLVATCSSTRLSHILSVSVDHGGESSLRA